MKLFRKLFGMADPPSDAKDGEDVFEELSRLQQEANQALDDIEATLDGEEAWFLREYDNEQPPACETGRKRRS